LTERRILVVGGSGVIGRQLVPLLVARGHRVTVLARSDASAQAAEAMGAQSVRGDILAPDTLGAAAAAQDAIVHLATRIPRAFPGRPDDFAENDRIRSEGTRHLLAAAELAGVARVVLQSIIWVHGDHGETWIDETAAIKPARLTRSAVDLETQGGAFAARTGATVTTLRCGSLYAADAWHTREVVRRLRGRTLPIVGDGANYQGFVHAGDAAAAFAAAATSDGATGTFFVTDDEPARMADFLRWLARAAGASAPLHLPAFMARLALGSEMEAAYGASVRCRNDRIKQQLGWAPRYATFRDGYTEIFAAPSLY
jgi:nucleoside-diphosphate-sugar epimerase